MLLRKQLKITSCTLQIVMLYITYLVTAIICLLLKLLSHSYYQSLLLMFADGLP